MPVHHPKRDDQQLHRVGKLES